MDTTPKYIKMCQKAYPIKEWKWKQGFDEGDFVFDGKKVRVVGHDFLQVHRYADRPWFRFAMREPLSTITFEQEFPDASVEAREGKYIVEVLGNPTWLPRQDQLQEMVFDNTVGIQSRCCAIYEFSISVNGVKFCLDDGSSEQLWLAFVMHEKCGKVWDEGKEEWIALSKK